MININTIIFVGLDIITIILTIVFIRYIYKLFNT